MRQSLDRYKCGCEQRDRLIKSLRSQITQFLNGQSSNNVQNQPIKSAVLPQLKGLAICILILLCLFSNLVTPNPLVLSMVTLLITMLVLPTFVPKSLSRLFHHQKKPGRRKVCLSMRSLPLRISNLSLMWT